MAQDALIDDIGQERRLRHQFIQQMRDVLLAIRHESFLVARPAPKRNHPALRFFAAAMPRAIRGPKNEAAAPAPVTVRRKFRRLNEMA
jgi:hypothetical protein